LDEELIRAGEEAVRLEDEGRSELLGSRKRDRRGKGDALNFRLTLRDIEILGFLLDQKFASLEQLYFRFFDVREKVTDPLPSNLFVTRQRLQILRRAGLVSTERVYSEAKSLYLLTAQGFQVFQSKRPHDAYATAIRQIDFRNYEHDTKVNDCRIAIERTGKIMKWVSERKIRMKGFESQFSNSELPDEIVPDGIFISSKGERIAFEIEVSPRKKARYLDKKHAFQGIMGGVSPLIHKVFWVGFTPRIVSDIRETVGHDENFLVESYGHFLAKLWPKGMPEKVEKS
jgi:hypothetical protein